MNRVTLVAIESTSENFRCRCFLLMLARDELAAEHIRQRLSENPPNRRARFVTLELSNTGLQVTRS